MKEQGHIEAQRQIEMMKRCRESIADRQKELGRPLTYHISTFGCQMNFKDSEKLAGILEEIGYVETDTEQADFVLLNTCTVREDIIHEIEEMVAEGVVEVMLLGQNVNSYGKTLEHPISFAELLERVEQVPGLKRIRFMTSHPKDLSDDLIQVMAKSEKICKHMHLPVQSGSSRLLEKMNRRYTKEHYLELVRKLRAAIPDISLTTDIIVGFPGETEEDFEETLDVVRQAEYDSAYTFIYSKRTGTPAANMEDQVPEEVVKERFRRLLNVVAESSAQRTGRLEGQTMEVLVEGISEQDPSMVTGRLSNNLLVHFPGDESLVGSLCMVHLDQAKGFYYIGSRRE